MDSKVFLAIDFAAKVHKDQVRKSDGVPYIAHPFAVMTLQGVFASDEVRIASLLHDTVEDSKDPTMGQQIEDLFGKKVREIVEECTETGTVGDGPKPPWEERKQATLDTLKEKSTDALLVIAADKLHNAMGLVTQYRLQGEDLWPKFKRGKYQQLWYYQSCGEALFEQAEYRRQITSSFAKSQGFVAKFRDGGPPLFWLSEKILRQVEILRGVAQPL